MLSLARECTTRRRERERDLEREVFLTSPLGEVKKTRTTNEIKRIRMTLVKALEIQY